MKIKIGDIVVLKKPEEAAAAAKAEQEAALAAAAAAAAAEEEAAAAAAAEEEAAAAAAAEEEAAVAAATAALKNKGIYKVISSDLDFYMNVNGTLTNKGKMLEGSFVDIITAEAEPDGTLKLGIAEISTNPIPINYFKIIPNHIQDYLEKTDLYVKDLINRPGSDQISHINSNLNAYYYIKDPTRYMFYLPKEEGGSYDPNIIRYKFKYSKINQFSGGYKHKSTKKRKTMKRKYTMKKISTKKIKTMKRKYTMKRKSKRR